MDTTRIKRFLIQHSEKVILATIVAVAGYLIFQGLTLPHFTDEHDPEQVVTRARQVRTSIDEDHTTAVLAEREPTLDILARTKAIDAAVDETPYKPQQLWEVIGSKTVVRRQDPQLNAPRGVVVTPVATLIAVQGSSSSDAYELAKLRLAADNEPQDEPERRRSGRRPRTRDPQQPEDGVGGGLSLVDPTRRGDDEEPPAREFATSTVFPPEQNFGVTARVTRDRHPKPQATRFICGAAVVPHAALYEAYELALRDADGYDRGRDAPRYVDFEVQRADVTEKPLDQVTDDDWKDIWNLSMYAKLAAEYWSSFAPEIVPVDYRDDALSNWIPPVLLDDYRRFITHPLVPLKSPAELAMDEDEPGLEPEIAAPRADEFFGDRRAAEAAQGGDRPPGLAVEAITTEEEEDEQVEYKLLRFYDFAEIGRSRPQPGRRYVYRVRFAVIDPNYPRDPESQPRLSSLAPDVAQRVLALGDQARRTNQRPFRRWSPWSEPSPPVSLPSPAHYFLGPVDGDSIATLSIGGKQVRYHRKPPTANAVSATYDATYGTRVTFPLKVTAGSVLSRAGETTVVDPIALEMVELEDAKVVSHATVIDISGGAALEITEDLKQPGMMLLYDDSGDLEVADEVQDLELYNIYSFPDLQSD